MSESPDAPTPSPDNVCDMLGFLHYQLSQQAKEIALLNRRVAELIQSAHEHNIALFIEASNRRLDSFGGSLKAVADRLPGYDSAIRDSAASVSAAVRADVDDRIQKIEARVAGAERAGADRLAARMGEAAARAAEQGRALAELQADVALLKRRRESSLQFMPIADVPPAQADAVAALQAEVRELRALAGRGAGARGGDAGPDRAEIAAIHARIDECAKKSELWQLAQCFIASGSDGVAELLWRRKAAQAAASAASGPEFAAKAPRQPAAHVRLISGECLKRPVTQHFGKLAKLKPQTPELEIPTQEK